MKKLHLYIAVIIVTSLFACNKEEFSPEGPTDVRIRNLSDQDFSEVIITTSENEEDIDTIPAIASGTVSDYCRFTKAYPIAEITAQINGNTFSTGSVSYTYLQYIGQDRITYEVYISNMNTRELTISNVIIEEPLILE